MNGLNDIVGQDAKEAGRWFSRDNLLINAYWGNKASIVNQRGLDEYTGIGYTIDGWRTWYETALVTLTDNCLKVSDWIIQMLDYEHFCPGEYTLSVLLASGQLLEANIFPAILSGVRDLGGGLYVLTGNVEEEHIYQELRVGFRANGGGFIAAKLEKGPEQHLAHKEGGKWVLNRVPDYWTELMKCQAYQNGSTHEFSAENIYNYGFALQAISSNAICGSIKFPVTMRKIPLVTIKRVRQIRTGTILTISSCYYSCTEDGITVVNNMAFDGGATLDTGEWYQVEYWADANP